MDFLEIGGVSLIVAFAAGLLSVLSPCVLPLIPAYLGYLTGAALETPPEQQAVAVSSSGGAAIAVAGGGPPAPAVPSPLLHSVAFVGGFTAVFVSFGVSLGLIGFFLKDHQDIVLKVSGTLLIIMGLHLAGVITIPFLEQERRFDVGQKSKVGYARSFFVGAAFSAGWSPCIGPTLGAIFALAVSSGTVAEAGILLLAYSAGLSIPFVAMGLAYNGVKPLYNRIKRYVGVINYMSGALLIIVGILIFTNSLINMNELFNFGFLPDVSNA
ncbi:MAG TPA: cytochrome c biogenesis protein CcdA [Dehalococcoidia bacterium]|jgi:cytochrome c-type biogenesis protein|nr:cytochrome c biogenesis protein CcdA [Dehalococcoidia bacterium]